MDEFFKPAPEPKTALGRYRILSPLAAIRVSPLCLGGMSLGQSWSGFMGSMDQAAGTKLLDAFYDAGGNFIDTANNYQDEESENIIGEWMETRGIRDQIVLATKYTTGYKVHDKSVQQKINFVGNNAKSMHLSVEASLKKLRTSYIDILYVHWWDHDTSVEEVMNGLHKLVMQGKVLYLGVSDTPAWVVAKANTYARLTGKTPFCVYQGAWSILQRDLERDIIPLCRSEGMALAPWNVIAGGKLRSDEEEKKRLESDEKGRAISFGHSPGWLRSENEKKVTAALEQVGKEVGGASVTAVAIAYVMNKTPYVFPIIGGRKIEHLYDNIKALSISLTPKQIEFLESQLPFDLGFPGNMIGDGTTGSLGVGTNSRVDQVPVLQPIRPQAAQTGA